MALPVSAFRSALALVLTMAATPPAWAQADAQAVTGKSVLVLSSDGSRQSGRLVSLTAADVTINRDGQDQRLALSGVKRVERVSHHVRNFMLGGLAAGFGVAVALCAQDDNFCGDDGFAGPALVFGGIGLGGGVGLGVIVKSATADSRVLYPSPGTAALSVAPFGARGGMGLGMRVRW